MSKPAPKTSSVPATIQTDHRKLGEQLTHQYRAAVSGMYEYVAFGALVLNIQEAVATARGGNSTRGPGSKNTGLRAWLKEYAPEVSEQTAHRCRDLAEGVKAEFKLGVRSDLHDILKGQNPDEKTLARREKIQSFLQGKSQRQLLLYIGKPGATDGGARVTSDNLTPAEREKKLIEGLRKQASFAFSAFHSVKEKEEWKLLNDDQLHVAVEDAKKFLKQAEKWLETPPPARVGLQIEKYLQPNEEAQS
jgi:hypothetical protein